MKNLLICVNPHGIDKESEKLLKVQIDNSLALGWQVEDILLITDFKYEYNGVKAVFIEPNTFCNYCPVSTKFIVINRMFAKGMVEKDQVYWVHDLDAFQLEPIEANVIGDYDMALCDYGRMPKWNCGSIFFKYEAQDIFERTKILMDNHDIWGRELIMDEVSLYVLTNNDSKIKNRINRLNITYNFQCFNIRRNYKYAEKPLKVIHFHPMKMKAELGLIRPLDFFMGKNKIGIKFVTEKLENIFTKYNIK